MTRLQMIGYGLTLIVTLMSAACVSTPTSGGADASALPVPTAGAGVKDYVLVDCLLPGQIRRLGTRMTYLSARRSVKTTERDCGVRGGEYVLFDRSDYASALTALLPKARSGDPVAQTYVGEIYEKGLGLASPTTMLPPNGIARPPTMTMLQRRSVSGRCTNVDSVYRRIRPRR